MSTVQTLLKDACNTAGGSYGAVSYRESYTAPHLGVKCVGIVGNFSDCMIIIAQVIKNLAFTLSSVAQDARVGNFEDLSDQEFEFESDIDVLMDFEQDVIGNDVIIYWPDLQPIDD